VVYLSVIVEPHRGGTGPLGLSSRKKNDTGTYLTECQHQDKPVACDSNILSQLIS